MAETIGNEIDRYISEGAKAYDSFEKTAEDISSKVRTGLGSISSQLGGLYDSFGYDERPAIEGEAKPLHPNMVAGFTPLRFIGVTRLPLLGAKVTQKVATWLTTKTTIGTNLPKQSLRSIASGKPKMKLAKAIAVGTGAYLMSKVRGKIPKTAIPGIITGMTVAHILTSPTKPLPSGSEISTPSWLMTPPLRRKRDRKWV